jgi:hypothetical protein
MRETGTNIFFGQQNLGVGHSAGQIFEHIIHRDAQAPDTRFAAPLARFDRDLPAYVIISLCLKPRAIGIVGDRNPVSTCWPCQPDGPQQGSDSGVFVC